MEDVAGDSLDLGCLMQTIIMRGLCATPPESLGRITSEWLKKKIVSSEFIEYLRKR